MNKKQKLLIFLILLLSGCKRPFTTTYPPGNYEETITVDGRNRHYILHVPTAVSANHPLPLVIVLHGGYGSGARMQKGVGFDAYADELGFLTAYPDAHKAHWHDGRNAAALSTDDIDDVKFILEMITEIGTFTAVDSNRIYVTGASNGGMMTYRLACQTEAVFAAVAPVIANVPQPIAADCAPSSPLPILSINGVDDPLIPLTGGEVCADLEMACAGGFVVSVDESIGIFTAVNNCNPLPNREMLPILVEDGTSVEKQSYLNCQNGGEVVSYIIHGGGHAWPPLSPLLRLSGASSGNLDATSLIVDFFMGGNN
ncbi:MAG: prolyl oligopeptidase family serine peptidase [Chloroflexi bacterium]|nr:prolyl oligopeptidase family serine peptidase [Chloroflexota bacterium]